MYDGLLQAGEATVHNLAPLRRAYLQVARGNVLANGVSLDAGDGAAVESETRLDLKAESDSELVLFDLP